MEEFSEERKIVEEKSVGDYANSSMPEEPSDNAGINRLPSVIGSAA